MCLFKSLYRFFNIRLILKSLIQADIYANYVLIDSQHLTVLIFKLYLSWVFSFIFHVHFDELHLTCFFLMLIFCKEKIMRPLLRYLIQREFGLTHWGRDQIDVILQTKFSNAFSWTKMYWFRLKAELSHGRIAGNNINHYILIMNM